jgi:glutathione peroxidase
MGRMVRAVAVAALMVLGGWTMTAGAKTAETAWDFTFTSIDGEAMPLSAYRGKALLVVNTASRCGFTPQYEGLQALWERYRERGLVVIGVPSNDFGGQEPGSATQIKSFCETNFAVDFPMTDKNQVVGAQAHPFYRWAAVGLGPDKAPSWNFHKYLIGPDGQLVASIPTRVEPTSEPVIAAVEKVLPK